MRKGELFLKPWAAPTVRSAAPIDLNNMAVNVNVLERNKDVQTSSRLDTSDVQRPRPSVVSSSGLALGFGLKP
jgi:hypothetical protein